MSTVPTPELTMKEIGRGVAEVYTTSGYLVGMITWNPDQMTSRWYATYANGDETADCADRYAALECLRLQHAAVQRFARSLRSIRPASEAHGPLSSLREWDRGYNSALRDVERLTQEVVGTAPDGEGYTAITRPTN